MLKSNRPLRPKRDLEADFNHLMSVLGSATYRRSSKRFAEALQSINGTLLAIALFWLRKVAVTSRRYDLARSAVQEWHRNMLATGFNSYRARANGRPFTPYAMRSLRNICISALRGKPPEKVDFIDCPDRGGDPSNAAELRELQTDLHAAIETLPERLRECLRLTYWEGLSGSAVAQQMGATVKTISTWNHRARQRLAMRLKRRGHWPR
jgi:RNA polymerase sigma factor (sigma-70 family)